jgi:hypothetical protein
VRAGRTGACGGSGGVSRPLTRGGGGQPHALDAPVGISAGLVRVRRFVSFIYDPATGPGPTGGC